jgi:hypothetical protein
MTSSNSNPFAIRLDLWKDKATKEEKRVWSQVKDVILLTEQIRQKDHLPYQELLQRAETCSLTQADIDCSI